MVSGLVMIIRWTSEWFNRLSSRLFVESERKARVGSYRRISDGRDGAECGLLTLSDKNSQSFPESGGGIRRRRARTGSCTRKNMNESEWGNLGWDFSNLVWCDDHPHQPLRHMLDSVVNSDWLLDGCATNIDINNADIKSLITVLKLQHYKHNSELFWVTQSP